jgi:hypothetical protein
VPLNNNINHYHHIVKLFIETHIIVHNTTNNQIKARAKVALNLIANKDMTRIIIPTVTGISSLITVGTIPKVLANMFNELLLKLATVSMQVCAHMAAHAVFNILAASAEGSMQKSTALNVLNKHLAHRKPALWFPWTLNQEGQLIQFCHSIHCHKFLFQFSHPLFHRCHTN